MTSICASHYSIETAFIQKIWALILRTQTQARDIFDLAHLLNQGAKIASIPEEMRSRLPQAQENALAISYDMYKSQVVSSLPVDYQKQYSDFFIWEKMVLQVVDYLNLCN